NARPHDDRIPLSPGGPHLLSLEHLDDHRIALGTEVAVELVALADLERNRANPVQEGRVVERIGDRRHRGIAPGLAVEPRTRADVELALPRFAQIGRASCRESEKISEGG